MEHDYVYYDDEAVPCLEEHRAARAGEEALCHLIYGHDGDHEAALWHDGDDATTHGDDEIVSWEG